MIIETFYTQDNFFVLNPKQISQYALTPEKVYKRIKFQNFMTEEDAKRVFAEIKAEFVEKVEQ